MRLIYLGVVPGATCVRAGVCPLLAGQLSTQGLGEGVVAYDPSIVDFQPEGRPMTVHEDRVGDLAVGPELRYQSAGDQATRFQLAACDPLEVVRV